jgi:pimeloyl-ACP methyl ester carboxylesterase
MNEPIRRCLKHGDRTIGYALARSQKHHPRNHDEQQAQQTDESNNKSAASAVIVYFYPLSGCSSVVSDLNLDRLQCDFLCVDRPGCGQTSFEPTQKDRTVDRSLHRIKTHIDDVRAVLHYHSYCHFENEDEVSCNIYSLGVCLGHAYAVELARQIPVAGLTLLAPFVSTASPANAWWVARLGQSVPNLVLRIFTCCAQAGAPLFLYCFITPSAIKKLVAKEESSKDWIEADYATMFDSAKESSRAAQHTLSIEAQFGTSSVWQDAVCDRFAKEMGLFRAMTTTTTTTNATVMLRSPPTIRIHASPHDKLAPFSSIQWVAERCYGGTCTITVHEDIHSHEYMTFFGGPLRNPVLLYQIAKEWGLLMDQT